MEDRASGPFDEYLPLFSNSAQRLLNARYAAARTSQFRSWKELCRYYGNKCLCCGRRRKLTRDHVIPRAQGGPNSLSNMQPLCGPCNRTKGNRVIDYREQARDGFVRALVSTVTE